MIKLHKIKRFWKKAFTPITIMLTPHSNIKTLKLKIPSIGIIIAIILMDMRNHIHRYDRREYQCRLGDYR